MTGAEMSSIETNTSDNPVLLAKDYKSELKPIWCPGCGDYAVLNSLTQAFAELQIPRHQIAVITGIGCSSRLPGYLSTYGFNALHGRAVPIATGVKLANPDTTVIVAGGDGDMFSIGGGHLSHAARRNIDMTLIVMDNRIYGLTKGQMSPTTPLESYTSTTQYGSYDPPVDMVKYMLAYGTGYVARGFAGNIKQLASLIADGIRYKGFAFIHVLSPCVTYRGTDEYQTIKNLSRDLPDGYNASDPGAAYDIACSTDGLYMGLIYRNDDLLPYDKRIQNMRLTAISRGEKTIVDLINEFRP